MSGQKKIPWGDHVSPFSSDASASSSSLDTSADLNSTRGSSIYPVLHEFQEYRSASQINTENTHDGSGDHAWCSTEENPSGSSEEGGSPKRMNLYKLGGMTMRSGMKLSPLKARPGIREKEMTPRQRHRQNHGNGDHVSHPHKCPRIPWWYYYIDIVTAVIIIAVLCLVIFPATQDEQKIEPVEIKDERVVIVTRFKALFAELRAEFPSQSRRFWRILQSATQSMLSKPHPLHPAVILMASDNASVATASCIARRFGSTVAQSYVNATHQPTLVDCANFIDQDAEEFKLKLHDALEAELSRGSKVAVVDNLQMMPGDTSVLFHGYCDNENAPYLDATFVLTLHMYDVAFEEPDDAIVEDFLDRVWGQDVEKENLAALYSRIANNIAFVNTEEPDLIARLCRQ